MLYLKTNTCTTIIYDIYSPILASNGIGKAAGPCFILCRLGGGSPSAWSKRIYIPLPHVAQHPALWGYSDRHQENCNTRCNTGLARSGVGMQLKLIRLVLPPAWAQSSHWSALPVPSLCPQMPLFCPPTTLSKPPRQPLSTCWVSGPGGWVQPL